MTPQFAVQNYSIFSNYANFSNVLCKTLASSTLRQGQERSCRACFMPEQGEPSLQAENLLFYLARRPLLKSFKS